VHLTRSRKW